MELTLVMVVVFLDLCLPQCSRMLCAVIQGRTPDYDHCFIRPHSSYPQKRLQISSIPNER
ncbi:hypothetical protein J6590_086860 [Homalodisca vitripennis]|nr:hypothetical protein J6590_086860 [Homalodisca vitripennis]